MEKSVQIIIEDLEAHVAEIREMSEYEANDGSHAEWHFERINRKMGQLKEVLGIGK